MAVLRLLASYVAQDDNRRVAHARRPVMHNSICIHRGTIRSGKLHTDIGIISALDGRFMSELQGQINAGWEI